VEGNEVGSALTEHGAGIIAVGKLTRHGNSP
jgi:hypothetical protein